MREKYLGHKYIRVQGHNISTELQTAGIVTMRKNNTGEAKEPCASSCGIVEINTQVYGINNIFMNGYH